MTNENKVFINRNFDCDAETLFDWLTRPALILQWFGPQGLHAGEVKVDLHRGGAYAIEMKKGDQVVFTILGEYSEIIIPDTLKFSYRYEGLTNPPPPSQITLKLTNIGDRKTNLSLVQEFKTTVPDFEGRSNAWHYMFGRLNKRCSQEFKD